MWKRCCLSHFKISTSAPGLCLSIWIFNGEVIWIVLVLNVMTADFCSFFFFFVRPTELNGMLGVSSHLDKTLACICTFSLPCNLWAAYYQSCQLPALCHVFWLNGNKTKFVLWWQLLRVWATCDVMTLADTVSVGISAFDGESRMTHVWLIQLLLGKFTLCHLSYHCKPLLK